jgi:flagellar motor switch protein FliG
MNPGNPKDQARDMGYAKAARFLVLLGKEQASEVLKHLSEEEVAGITQEIAALQRMDTGEASKILEEFGYLVRTKDLVARGGVEMAKEILRAAFDEEKANALIEKLALRTAPHPFSFLMDLDLEQVKALLRVESPQVLAVIIPHLAPERGAQVLASLPPEVQIPVVRRMARLREINPEVLRQAEGSLREKVRAQGQIVTQELDGQSVLAEILKNMPSEAGRQILDGLRLEDRALAQSLAKRLMTLDVLFAIPDRDLQAVLRDFSDSELALLVKGLGDLQQARLAANLSERRWQLIEQESDALGSVFRSEVDRAVQEFLDYIRLQREKGEIQIIRDGETTVE